METIEGMKKRIETTEDLQSVVKTMKSLAAVNIRHYQAAVQSLEGYNKTVTMGLHIVLRSKSIASALEERTGPADTGIIIFGSDQGMCGSLNEDVFSLAMDYIDLRRKAEDVITMVCVGDRMTALLENENLPIEASYSVPGSVSAITYIVQELLTRTEAWGTQREIGRVVLFHSKPASGASYDPNRLHLLPIGREWLKNIKGLGWEGRGLPTFSMDMDHLFSDLIREYLFVSLFRAIAESLASENASRLAAMQGAEKNIEERLQELKLDFYRHRQKVITEELLDIISGFEALKETTDGATPKQEQSASLVAQRTVTKGVIMPEKVFFEAAFHLAREVKGGELTVSEKRSIIDDFYKESGPAFDCILAAIARVLHATPALIREKGEAIDEIGALVEETKHKARLWEAHVSKHL